MRRGHDHSSSSSKDQAVSRSDVSGASVLPAPRGGDVTPYHLAGLGCLGGCPGLTAMCQLARAILTSVCYQCPSSSSGTCSFSATCQPSLGTWPGPPVWTDCPHSPGQ